MNGRKEHEVKIEKRIYTKLKNSPKYVSDFCDYLVDKTYTSKEQYINCVLQFLEFLKDNEFDVNNVESFNSVKVSDINKYIRSLENLSSCTRASRMYAIKSFFVFLFDDEYIDRNPFDKVKMPKDSEQRKITFLTKEEIKIVENNIKNGVGNERSKKIQNKWTNRDMALIITALSLGLRVSSLVEIDIEDVDLEDKTIRITEKGNKTRTIQFSSGLKDILNNWINDRKEMVFNNEVHALFISSRGDRISQSGVTCLIKKYTYNIDKHITPHKLRSTCATNIYNKTGDIYLTADVLGHSNIANTRRYAQISEERKKKAAEAMDDILF